MSSPLLGPPQAFVNACGRQWQKTMSMLESNPSLVTQSILCLALKNRPPVSLLHYMIKMNPDILKPPLTGPSPLQVAIQSGCSLDAVKFLIEKYPYALVQTNDDHLDPLALAKRFRPSEKALLELLSRPLNEWINPSEASTPKRKNSPVIREKISLREAPLGPIRFERFSSPSTKVLDAPDHEVRVQNAELENVKILCVQVIKSHQRLMKRDLKVQRHFEIQAIANDMREKATQYALKKANELKAETENLVATELKYHHCRLLKLERELIRLKKGSAIRGPSLQKLDLNSEYRALDLLHSSRIESISPIALPFPPPSPIQVKEEGKDDDDVRSLLSEDTLVHRKPVRRIFCLFHNVK